MSRLRGIGEAAESAGWTPTVLVWHDRDEPHGLRLERGERRIYLYEEGSATQAVNLRGDQVVARRRTFTRIAVRRWLKEKD